MKNKAFDHSKYPRWIDPNEVTEYERNAKKHTERQVANIATSIRRFGWQQDVVITTDKVLVIGHGRRLAALKLGCEMPYHVIDKTADELTEADIRELRIIDNKTNESPWNWDALELDMEGLDFDGFDLDIGTVGGGNMEDYFEAFFTPAESKPEDNKPASSETDSNPQPERFKVQCPHCGEWFEP